MTATVHMIRGATVIRNNGQEAWFYGGRADIALHVGLYGRITQDTAWDMYYPMEEEDNWPEWPESTIKMTVYCINKKLCRNGF